MKPCNYWNYNSSFLTIVDNGNKLWCISRLEDNQLSPANLSPRTIGICGTEVNLDNLIVKDD